jgi:hypothetical protein
MEATMIGKYGWAAFLASLAVLCSSLPATTAGLGPTFACFAPSNAGLIGRLGPDDASVRAAFEAGACLALPAGITVKNAEHAGTLWQFQARGGVPVLYAADWAAGFTGSGDDQMAAAFSRFLSVTGHLLEVGDRYVDCYDASDKLSQRWRDLDRRWREYALRGTSRFDSATSKTVIYVGDEAPRMAAEREALLREGRALDSRCAPYEAIVTDRDFIAFMHSARHTA